MKRKKVLQTEPVKTKMKGRVITVQEADELLILNIYQDKKLTDRKHSAGRQLFIYRS